MTFQHDAKDCGGSVADLLCEAGGRLRLSSVVFIAIAVAAVDHDAGAKTVFDQLFLDFVYGEFVKIGSFVGTAEN